MTFNRNDYLDDLNKLVDGLNKKYGVDPSVGLGDGADDTKVDSVKEKLAFLISSNNESGSGE
jgi:hypothetical protein